MWENPVARHKIEAIHFSITLEKDDTILTFSSPSFPPTHLIRCQSNQTKQHSKNQSQWIPPRLPSSWSRLPEFSAVPVRNISPSFCARPLEKCYAMLFVEIVFRARRRRSFRVRECMAERMADIRHHWSNLARVWSSLANF